MWSSMAAAAMGFEVREFRGFGLQKQSALDLCTGEWVLSIDSDDVVSETLRRSIQRAVADPHGKIAFRMKRATWFAGV